MDEQTDDPVSPRHTPTGQGHQEPRAMEEHGAVGKQFTREGAIGGAADKAGWPLSEEGDIGKQFTAEGDFGGEVQRRLGDMKKATDRSWS